MTVGIVLVRCATQRKNQKFSNLFWSVTFVQRDELPAIAPTSLKSF